LRATRNCLKIFRDKALAANRLDAGAFDQIDREVLALIEDAVQEARSAPPPDAADVTKDVYVTY
jgi:pyruvate dehydrogenase E1 component alpha subunit